MHFLLVIACCHANAQTSNLIIFSEDGDVFTLFVNGERQNMDPEINVKAREIKADGCKVKVVFKDASLPEFSKYIMLEPNEELTFGIKRNKKGAYVLRLVSTSDKTDTKMSVAKQALKRRCLTVNQVIGFVKLFSHRQFVGILSKTEFVIFRVINQNSTKLRMYSRTHLQLMS
jgi:hypothetical protein